MSSDKDSIELLGGTEKVKQKLKWSLTLGEQAIALWGTLGGVICLFIAVQLQRLSENIWAGFTVDIFRELATVAFTLTIFEGIKDIYLRRQTKEQNKLLINEVAEQTKRILEEKNNLAAAGIGDALPSFTIRNFEAIVKTELSSGDSLYCHDGTISDIMEVRDLIVQCALQDIKFRFMSLAPYCMNARRRAKEVSQESNEYLSLYKVFSQNIEDIRSRIYKLKGDEIIARNSLSCETKDERIIVLKPFAKEIQEYVDNVQIRYFRSLLSIPFYLLEKGAGGNSGEQRDSKNSLNRSLAKAWTGFYLRRGASGFMFIEWKAREQVTSTSVSWPDMIQSLKDYWDFKWVEGFREYKKSASWLGTWRYECVDKNLSDDPVYTGSYEIRERSGRFVAVCTRTKTCIPGSTCVPYNLRWTNEADEWTNDRYDDDEAEDIDGGDVIHDVIHKYQRGKYSYLFIVLSYRPDKASEKQSVQGIQGETQSASAEKMAIQPIKSFVTLKAINQDELEGSYHIAFADESQKEQEADKFPSTSGRIKLYREPSANK